MAMLGTAAVAVGGFIATYGSTIAAVASIAMALWMKGKGGGPGGVDQFQEGPRIGELGVTTSTYGKDIPKVWGAMRLAGNMFWATEIDERVITTVTDIDAGGGGGGWFGKGGGSDTPTMTEQTYVYYGNFAISIAEGVAHRRGLIRVWADGKLIWDRRPGESKSKKYEEMDIRMYPGTKTQNPDSFIEADVGAANCPAYRDQCYIVIENMPLADVGNRPPNFTAEISFNAADSNPVTDLGELDSVLRGIFWDRVRSTIWAHDSDNISRINLATNAIEVERPIADLQDSPPATWNTDEGCHVTPEGYFIVKTNDTPVGYDRAFMLHVQSLETERFCTRKIHPINTWFLDCTRVNKTHTTGMGRYIVAGTNAGIHMINLNINSGTILGIFGTDEPEMGYQSHQYFPEGANYFADAVQTDREGIIWLVGAQTAASNNSCILWQYEIRTAAPTSATHRHLESFDFGVTGVNENHTPVGMAYDAATHSLIIATIGGFGGLLAKVFRWDIETETKIWEKTGADVTAGLLVHGKGSKTLLKYHTAGPYVYTMDDGNRMIYQIRVSDGEITEEIDLDDWGIASSWSHPVYDGSTHTIVAQAKSAGPYLRHMVRLWLDRADTSGVPLEDVVADLATRTGLTTDDLDLTQLVASGDIVRGYMVTKQSTVRSALEPLGIAYHFDAIESDHKVKFVKRGGASVATIVENDLGASSGGRPNRAQRLIEEFSMEAELPNTAAIQFYNPNKAYQQGHEYEKRISNPIAMRTQGSEDTRTADLAMALTPAEARSIVETHLYQVWIGKRGYKFNSLPKHQLLEPTDVVTVENDGVSVLARLVAGQLGAGFICAFTGLSEDVETYNFSGLGTSGGDGHYEHGMEIYGVSYPHLLDVPLLRDYDDPGIFNGMIYLAIGASSDVWRGAVVHRSEDGAVWDQVAAMNRAVAWGTSVEPAGGGGFDASLEPFDRWMTWDRTSQLRVRMADGEDQLASVTELQALNGANTAILGHEIIRFVNVSGPDGNGIYTLDTLIRGRRGTGQYAEFGHARGSRFILLSTSTVTIVNTPLSHLNSVRYYRAITLSTTMDDAALYDLIWTAACLKPYFVAHLEASRDGSDNVDLAWVRRSRTSGDLDWQDQQGDIPLGETEEAYEVDYFGKYLAGTTSLGSLTTTIRDIGGFAGYSEEDLVGKRVSIQHQDDYLTEEYSVITAKLDDNRVEVDPPWDTAPAASVPYSIQNLVADRTEQETVESSQYSAAEQTTDGLTPGDLIYAVVYQISSVVGRGFPRDVWTW